MSNLHSLAPHVHFIRIDNAPVNGLNNAIRQYIVAELDAAQQDEKVTAVVLMGAGKVFSGGADMREFGTAMEAAEPHLNTVIARLENFPKPVIAVLHGVAMGGGLELAMGCNYRLITPNCKIALPEIKLGLMPGGGGTQRLPRLTNMEIALAVIVSGDIFQLSDFAATSFCDGVITDGDTAEIAAQAVIFANAIGRSPQLPRTCDRTVEADASGWTLQAAKLAGQASVQWYPAPLHCIKAIEASASLPFAQGLELERTLFLSLLESETSKALRYQFFAERAIGKIRDLPAGAITLVVSSPVIVGVGDDADYLYDMLVRADIATTRLTASDIGDASQCALLAAADVVFLYDANDLESITPLLHALEKLVADSCLLVSLSHHDLIDDVASDAVRPSNIAGLYLGAAGDKLPVVEIIRGRATAPQTASALMALCKRMRKTGVVAPGSRGFVGPRLLATLMQHKKIMVETGVPERVIDQALRGFGFLEGACLRSNIGVDDGNLAPSDKSATSRDIVTDITRALGDEAALLLAESDLITATDIDMIFTKAYGFPRHCGGPVYYRKIQQIAD